MFYLIRASGVQHNSASAWVFPANMGDFGNSRWSSGDDMDLGGSLSKPDIQAETAVAWAQCDNPNCQKWRKLPPGTSVDENSEW